MILLGRATQGPRRTLASTVGAEAAFAQESVELCVATRRQIAQPADDALLDLARGLAREGDRQNLARRNAFEQQAHDARSEQPGFAAPGTGFDNDGSLRVQCAAGEVGGG